MKKLLLVIFMFLILINSKQPNNFSLLDYFTGEYQAYTMQPELENNVFLGNCYINYGKINNNNLLIGESMTINNFEPSSALQKLKAIVVKTEYLENGATVIYAYSPLINKNVKLNNRKVNLQIAHYEQYSVIGWPLILGSF